MLTRTALDAARQITRRASALDAAGRHADADNADRAVQRAAQRVAANWLTNGYNAVAMGLHSGEPLFLLGTMRVQVNNLLTTVQAQRGYFTPSIQSLAEQLVRNVLTWLNAVQEDLFSDGGALNGVGLSPTPAPQNTASRNNTRSRIVRLAGAGGTVESCARAALGVLQYLDRKELFPQGPEALRRITQDIQALIALVLGEIAPESIANQMAINGQAGETSRGGEDPMAAKAEGVRQSLGKGTDSANANAVGGYGQVGQVSLTSVEDREAHIQRYLDYMARYGYSAMVARLKQYEGDVQFIALVKQRAQTVQSNLGNQNNGQQEAQNGRAVPGSLPTPTSVGEGA